MSELKLVLIQASSISWQGSKDACMTLVEGSPIVELTLIKLKTAFPDVPIKIIAPEFDKNGALARIAKRFDVDISFNYNDSPAKRIEKATEKLEKSDFFIRIDGLNFCVREVDLLLARDFFKEKQLDFLKFADDFPPQISFEVYRKEAYCQMMKRLAGVSSAYSIHIKHIHTFLPELKKEIYVPKNLGAEFLSEARLRMSPVYEKPRGITGSDAIRLGDQLSFHYEVALEYVKPDMKVLDVACGDGAGSRLLAKSVARVVGVDIDELQINENLSLNNPSNVEFLTENGEHLPFGDGYFDFATSMETIEHCNDPKKFLHELSRVLKTNSLVLISTPQNSHGHIPLNVAHNIEFTAKEFVDLLETEFHIVKFIPIKSGRVVNDDGPLGQNSLAICRKK